MPARKPPTAYILQYRWELQEITIKRKKWLRGEGVDKSLLLRADGKMCVLGQYLNQCGVKRAQLRGNAAPWEVGELPARARWLNHPPTVTLICAANDTTKWADIAREWRLKQLFGRFHVRLTFTD